MVVMNKIHKIQGNPTEGTKAFFCQYTGFSMAGKSCFYVWNEGTDRTDRTLLYVGEWFIKKYLNN